MSATSSEPAGERAAVPLAPMPEPGAVFEVWWPFQRENYNDGEGPHLTWAPGFTRESYGEYQFSYGWDGEGQEVRTIVSVHTLPKPYKPRVFYTRQWRSPNGRLFGRRTLRICGLQAFENWRTGKKVAFLENDRDENAEVTGYNSLDKTAQPSTTLTDDGERLNTPTPVEDGGE